MINLNLIVNGDARKVAVETRLTLLEVLRENMLLTGTKEGCGVGECGTCVVLADGEPITSCLVLAGDADGVRIETIEGLASDGELSEVQQAFVKTGALIPMRLLHPGHGAGGHSPVQKGQPAGS